MRLFFFEQSAGNCLVPDDEGDSDTRALAVWVHRQRAARGSLLSEERETRLSALGFEWDPYVSEW